ncbi:hypothetical protein V2J09_007133 [Rumex salicifolius]
MQGKRSAIGSVPDSINFEYGSPSNNMGIDQQICWNTLQNHTDAMLSECQTTPGSSGSMGNISQKTRNLSRWNIGEPSSRNPAHHDGRVCQDGLPSSMAASSEIACSRLEDHHVYDQISVVSRNNVDLNLNGNQIPNTVSSNIGSTSSAPFASSSGSGGGFLAEEEDNKPDYVLDGRRLSCKRKNIEGNAGNGQSSSSSTSMWQALPPPTNNGNDTINPPAWSANPRLRLGIGGVAQDSSYVPNTGVPLESSLRNYRVRVNPRTEEDSFPNPLVRPQVTEGLSNVPVSHRPLRYVPINPPGLQRNVQRMQEGNTPLHQDLNSRPVPRNISELPMFMPSVEIRNSSAHNPTAMNSNGTSRNVAPSYRAGPGIGSQSSSGPTWGSHRQASSSSSQYSRRLSEYVRRSLLSSVGPESGLHYGPASAHCSAPSSSSSSFQEVIIPTGGGAHGHGGGAHGHGDDIPGIPYSLRGALAVGGEGRSRLVSEHIHSVLDMMRRGEGLRFEHESKHYDVMILDPSIFFGMADFYDEHRDMRLDVDNMSYEELLALEERIGNVSTGLAEDKIVARLKQKRYTKVTREDHGDVEPCCICQEVYKNGEEMGALDCGHDFHAKCIKQWLQHKNSCPICKTTGLAT